MSASVYKEFQWTSEAAGNGESGVGLANVFLELVKGLEDVKTLCDLGCGNGFMAGRLAQLGYDVTGVDASESGIALARSTYPQANFVCATVNSDLRDESLPESFDLVLSSDVIEHMYRPADLIEAAVSLVKPNGYVLIGTPYHGYMKNLALALSGKLDTHFCVHDVGGHIKFFSVKTLSELLHRHGLCDLKFTYYGRAPWLWMNMICLARKPA